MVGCCSWVWTTVDEFVSQVPLVRAILTICLFYVVKFKPSSYFEERTRAYSLSQDKLVGSAIVDLTLLFQLDVNTVVQTDPYKHTPSSPWTNYQTAIINRTAWKASSIGEKLCIPQMCGFAFCHGRHSSFLVLTTHPLLVEEHPGTCEVNNSSLA